MKSVVGMAALILATATAPVSNLYDVRLKVVSNGETLATPRLLVRAGEQARFVTDDGAGVGWSVEMTPTPGTGAGTATVAIGVALARRSGDGVLTTRRMTTTAVVKDPGAARFEVPAPGGASGLSVDLAVASTNR